VETALRDGNAIISTQVVQEFLSLATRKFASSFKADDLRAYLDGVLIPLCKIFPDAALYGAALELRGEIDCSFYDALIIAGALRASCKRLYSEDMQNGRMIRGLVIENPFKA
jgi:predicted nucleic acid-binding protein